MKSTQGTNLSSLDLASITSLASLWHFHGQPHLYRQFEEIIIAAKLNATFSLTVSSRTDWSFSTTAEKTAPLSAPNFHPNKKIMIKINPYYPANANVPLSLEVLIAQRRNLLAEPQRGGRMSHGCREGSRGWEQVSAWPRESSLSSC